MEITKTLYHITQDHIDAVNNTVGGGMVAIYNTGLKQALKKRWDNIDAAKSYAQTRLCSAIL